MKSRITLFLSLFIIFSACKKEDTLKGIDKAALFAPPLLAEIKNVENIWAARILQPTDVTIEKSAVINDRLTLHIFSFRLSGIKEYAAALVPETDNLLPVMFYVGGYASDEEPVNSVNIKLGAEPLPFIYIVPALRGQYVSVTIDNITYSSAVSEGARTDAFDGATDDVIASLNAAGELFPNADTATAMIRGASRGGIVGLLAGERDQRFKRVVPVAFNVDFIGLTAAQYNDRTYKEQFLTGLIDGTANIAETRRLMIAASPLYFCERLPKTQLHCAEKDKITPAAQGQMLVDRMKEMGLADSVELFIYPGREHHTIGTNNPEMETRITGFFSELW